jgi:hypothetical protein
MRPIEVCKKNLNMIENIDNSLTEKLLEIPNSGTDKNENNCSNLEIQKKSVVESTSFIEPNIEESVYSNLSLKVRKRKSCDFCKIYKIMVHITKDISNFKLLKQNRKFLLIAIANLFAFSGYFLPFIYIPIRAKELKIENISALLSVIGMLYNNSLFFPNYWIILSNFINHAEK